MGLAFFLTFTPAVALAQPLAPAALQSQYDATPSNGTVTIPAGAWPSAGWWAPFRPTKSDPGKSILWNFTTPTPPQSAIGDNDLTESFWGGHLSLQRNILTGAPGNPSLFLSLDDDSRGYTPIPYNWVGEFADVPALQINATTHAGSLGQLNGIEINLASQGNNPAVSEDQGLNIGVEKSGRNSTWAISTMTNDTTGRPPDAFASIAAELDLLANGPDDRRAEADPERGNRIFLWLVGKVSPMPAWVARRQVGAGARVLANQTVYVAANAGTTGAAAPAWPAAGTVRDGGVTWRYGEPYAVSFGRGIALDAQAGQPASFDTGFSSNAGFANAVLDLSAATLLRPGSAGLRLAADMPVDFSGNATAAGQNRHTLSYSTAALVYKVAGSPALSITDAGHIATAGPAPGLSACGAGAALSPTASDRHGTITPGAAATACTIVFAAAYATPPDCLLTGFSATPPYIAAITATSLTVRTSRRFTYLCEQ